MGAVSVANVTYNVQDNRAVREADVTFSASYATGGDTLNPGLLGLSRISRGDQVSSATPAHGLQVVTDVTLENAPKLKVVQYAAGTPAEMANATNLSSRTVRMRFLGRP